MAKQNSGYQYKLHKLKPCHKMSRIRRMSFSMCHNRLVFVRDGISTNKRTSKGRRPIKLKGKSFSKKDGQLSRKQRERKPSLSFTSHFFGKK